MNLPITAVIVSLVSILVLTVGIIIFMRYLMRKRSDQDLTGKHHGTDWQSPIKARNKYPDVNVFKYSGVVFRYGLAAALAIMLISFNYTQFEAQIYIPEDALELDEEIEIEPPRTKEPPPPPPPPPPPVIEEVPEEELLEEEEPEFVDQSVEEETVIEEPPPEPVKEAPPPPPPPPPEPEVEEIFTIVEENPRFPGCEDKPTKAEKEACAKEKLLQFLYKNLKYPPIARENGVEGTVVIQFVVEKDGSVTDANIARDIGAGCGEEALRVVNMMDGWTPGRQRGKSVRVQFTLPVKFKLE